ncbi:hypothetical protein DT075_37570 [Bacillus licheniformis]|nr:hypothetical protein DT075_37570 [Bacillus licheniformis]
MCVRQASTDRCSSFWSCFVRIPVNRFVLRTCPLRTAIYTFRRWRKPGEEAEFQLVYYLPISGPSNFTISIDGKKYRLKGN